MRSTRTRDRGAVEVAIFFFPRFRNKLATDILPIGDCGANVTMARSYGRL